MAKKDDKWVKIDSKTEAIFVGTGTIVSKSTKKGDCLCYVAGMMLGERKGNQVFKPI